MHWNGNFNCLSHYSLSYSWIRKRKHKLNSIRKSCINQLISKKAKKLTHLYEYSFVKLIKNIIKKSIKYKINQKCKKMHHINLSNFFIYMMFLEASKRAFSAPYLMILCTFTSSKDSLLTWISLKSFEVSLIN